jgi:adenylate cyclase
MSVEDQSDEDLDQEFDAVPEPSENEDAVPEPAKAIPTGPPTGAMSAERLAIKALEARLLGGERKLRRREIAAGAGVARSRISKLR